jgi:uncharacterized protein (TIGR03382 family)
MSRLSGGLLLAIALALSGCGGEHPQGSFLGRLQQALGAPSITGFSPESGTTGTMVTVEGSDFTGTKVVRFNGVATRFSVISDTQLQAFVPEGVRTGRLLITNGSGSITSAKDFTVPAPPELASFSPRSGPPGTQVVLTGSHLATTRLVSFGSATADFTVDSDTQVTVTVPPGARTGPISVGTDAGNGSYESSFSVFSAAVPTISSFSPTTISPHGFLTLTGTGFTGTLAVSIDGAAVSWFNVVSDTELSFNVPTSAATGRIRVYNTRGVGVSSTNLVVEASSSPGVSPTPGTAGSPALRASLAEGPTLTGFSPGSGEVGTSVTVTGSGFTSIWGISVGNESAAYQVVSDTELTLVVPPGARSGRIRVESSRGPTSSPSDFRVDGSAVPVIHGVTPSRGSPGTSVRIDGAYFTGATEVSFNGVPVSYFQMSDGRIQTYVPEGATTGRIRVTHDKGTGSSSTDFAILPGPAISAFTPESGEVGSAVTVTGMGLGGTRNVRFGEALAAFQVDSDTQLTVFVPYGANNERISVETTSGYTQSDSPFLVRATVAPTITRLSRLQGGVNTEITLFGAGFTGATQVLFNGVPASYVRLRGDGQLETRVPSGATTGPIVVKNAAGSASSVTFTVVPPPAITGFSPTRGPVGTTVTLTGKGFTGATEVRFGGQYTSELTVISDTQMTAVVPEGASSGPLSVSSLGGSGTSTAHFTVESSCAPTITSFSPTEGGPHAWVRVLGTCFTGLTRVEFNGRAVDYFSVESDTELNTFVPDDATTGPLRVTNTLGSGSSSTNFTVLAPPTITAITPSSGKAGDTLTLTGTGFTGTGSVSFPGGVEAVFTVVSDTEMTLTVPSGATSGRLNVSSRGGYGTSSVSFTAISSVVPTVDGFSPTSGGVHSMVRIQGSGFTGTTKVTFNGVVTTSVQVLSDTSMRAYVPDGATTGKVEVTNTLGTGSSSGVFTVLPSPIVTGFTPTSGAAGTEVTLTGTGFSGAFAVLFNGVSAELTPVSDTQLKAIVPTGAASGPISVSSPGGTGSSKAVFRVPSSQAPVITSFSPTQGGAGIGATVSILGMHFSGTTEVKFNDTSAERFHVVSDGELSVEVPYGATTGPLTVVNNIGSDVSSVVFTVLPPPTLTGFSPESGTPGTTVTLTGTGFTGATEVGFGWPTPDLAVEAEFTVVSDTRIDVTVPEGALPGPILVETDAGLAVSRTDFTPTSGGPPTVSGFEPAQGRPGMLVVLQGTNLTGVTAVRFNGVPSPFLASNDGNLYATVPVGATTGPVTVVNNAGSGTSATDFTVVDGDMPSLTSVSPEAAPRGARIALEGSNLTRCSVLFSGTEEAETLSNTGTRIELLVPEGAHTGYIGLNCGGGEQPLIIRFRVIEPPRVASVSPATAHTHGGTKVTVTGVGFEAGATLTLGGVAASGITVVDGNTLTATVGASSSAGVVDVVVTNTNGLSGTLRRGFTYEASRMALTAVSPASGPTTGGTRVTLSGNGFAPGATVTLGGIPATSVVIDSETSLTAIAPPHAAGAVDVVVINPDNDRVTLAGAFTYVQPAAPTVSSLDPSTGPTAGGTAVTLGGTHFVSGARVLFDGVEATDVRVVSATSLTAVTPPHAAGAVEVVVINPDGQSGSLGNGFTYADPTQPGTGGGKDDDKGGCSSTSGGPSSMAPLALLGLGLLLRRRRDTV